MGTRLGSVKVVIPEWPTRGNDFEIIGLKQGDEVVGAKWLKDGSEEMVFITDDAQLLHFPAKSIRPQGRSGAGMAGIKLDPAVSAISFSVVETGKDAPEAMVVTFTGITAKVTPLSVYPGKSRATGGVRCHKFIKGADKLLLAWVGPNPAASNDKGDPMELPDADEKRDGSGTASEMIQKVGSLVERA